MTNVAKCFALLFVFGLLFFILAGCSPENMYLFFKDDTLTFIKGESFDLVDDLITTNLLKNTEFTLNCSNDEILYINGTNIDAVMVGSTTLNISAEHSGKKFTDSVVITVCEDYESGTLNFNSYLYFEDENISMLKGESRTIDLKGILRDRGKICFYPEGVVEYNKETSMITALNEGKVEALAEISVNNGNDADMKICASLNIYVESKLEVLDIELLDAEKNKADFVMENGDNIAGYFLAKDVHCLADYKLESTFKNISFMESVVTEDGFLIPFIAHSYACETGRITYVNDGVKIESNILNFNIYSQDYNKFPSEVSLMVCEGYVENSFTIYVNSIVDGKSVYFPFDVYILVDEETILPTESEYISNFETVGNTIQLVCIDSEDIKIKVVLKNLPEIFAECCL